jgi:hypothetical protein
MCKKRNRDYTVVQPLLNRTLTQTLVSFAGAATGRRAGAAARAGEGVLLDIGDVLDLEGIDFEGVEFVFEQVELCVGGETIVHMRNLHEKKLGPGTFVLRACTKAARERCSNRKSPILKRSPTSGASTSDASRT